MIGYSISGNDATFIAHQTLPGRGHPWLRGTILNMSQNLNFRSSELSPEAFVFVILNWNTVEESRIVQSNYIPGDLT